MNQLTVYDVFQSSGVPKHTLIEIEENNNKILSFLSTPGEHLVIHGPSKTGKTTLWSTQIGEDNVIRISCGEDTTIEGVFQQILEELSDFYVSSISNENARSAKSGASIKAKIPGFLEGAINPSSEAVTNQSVERKPSFSPAPTVSRIAKSLKSENKHVIVENIHYSSREFRSQLAKELHNLSDYDSKWILVGVQHQADQVFIENRDLVGRLREVKCGVFSRDKVEEILRIGGELLNISFSKAVTESIYRESGGYAALIQDIAKNVCIEANIFGFQEKPLFIADEDLVDLACVRIAETFTQLYLKFADDIIKGGRSDGSTEKYKWFLRIVKNTDFPNSGMLKSDIYNRIVTLGNQSIPQNSVTQGLQYINKLQEKRGIQPPVLEYDDAKGRLYLIDPYFRFCLRWVEGIIDKEDD